jgi:long-chain fatty acid transport protein
MMRSLVLLSAAAATIMAAGYKIPESSINATALSAAYVANAHGADAAYYNPAAMVYNDDAGLLEVDATYIGLSKIHYASTSGAYNIDSKSESFLVPTLHYSSKKLGDNGARVGFSIVAPAGLSKRWTSAPAVYSAEEFTLQTIELNPSIAVPLSDTLSMGVGFRIVRTNGVVKSTSPVPATRDLTGDSIDYGYNLALNYRPIHNLSLAATYRSKIDLNVEGSADLRVGATTYSGPASVTIPLPAALNLAAAYTFDSDTTVEAVFERTYWAAYKDLDFNYDGTLNAATVAFGAPISKNWTNTNTYRLGLTQKIDKLTAMAGVAYDKTPVPETTLGYELPDSNAIIVSLGGRYQIDKQWNVGLAGLVDMKKDRTVHQSGGSNPVNGEFSNSRAYLVTAGIEYHF